MNVIAREYRWQAVSNEAHIFSRLRHRDCSAGIEALRPKVILATFQRVRPVSAPSRLAPDPGIALDHSLSVPRDFLFSFSSCQLETPQHPLITYPRWAVRERNRPCPPTDIHIPQTTLSSPLHPRPPRPTRTLVLSTVVSSTVQDCRRGRASWLTCYGG